jgi:hypothetical protein
VARDSGDHLEEKLIGSRDYLKNDLSKKYLPPLCHAEARSIFFACIAAMLVEEDPSYRRMTNFLFMLLAANETIPKYTGRTY